jgi:hypothetical protein
MPLTAGTDLGPYQIVGLLGAAVAVLAVAAWLGVLGERTRGRAPLEEKCLIQLFATVEST